MESPQKEKNPGHSSLAPNPGVAANVPASPATPGHIFPQNPCTYTGCVAAGGSATAQSSWNCTTVHRSFHSRHRLLAAGPPGAAFGLVRKFFVVLPAHTAKTFLQIPYRWKKTSMESATVAPLLFYRNTFLFILYCCDNHATTTLVAARHAAPAGHSGHTFAHSAATPGWFWKGPGSPWAKGEISPAK